MRRAPRVPGRLSPRLRVVLPGGTQKRASDDGVVLVNVLVVLALAASLVYLMFGAQDVSLERARLISAASQADALARAGETSVVLALRRDMAEAPDIDHMGEPWAIAVQQQEVRLSTGRFSVTVEDLQGRFDVNRLVEDNLQDRFVVERLVALLELPETLTETLIRGMVRNGPVRGLWQLRDLGVPRAALEALSPYLVALPAGGDLNLNSAPSLVLNAVLGNQAAARRLELRRERQGFVTPDDLKAADLLLPPGAGFTSDTYAATTSAEVDGITVTLRSVLLRISNPLGQRVEVLERFYEPAPPAPN